MSRKGNGVENTPAAAGEPCFADRQANFLADCLKTLLFGWMFLTLATANVFAQGSIEQSGDGPASIDPPEIYVVSPQETHVGNWVNINGANFIDVTEVTFGGVPVYFEVLWDKDIDVRVPDGTGEVDVIVHTSHGSSTPTPASRYRFRYIPPPVVVDSFSFDPGSGSISFQGDNMSGARNPAYLNLNTGTYEYNAFISSSQNSVIIYPFFNPFGLYSISFAVGDGGYATTQCVCPSPSISSIAPAEAAPGRATRVTLTGDNFVGTVTSVAIGGVTVPAENVTVDSRTSLSFLAPENLTGLVEVTATTPGGTSAAAPGGFRYTSDDATLKALSLSAGTLEPAFAPHVKSYTATVPFSADTLTVTPTANDRDATTVVNTIPVASGSASGAIELGVGSNTVSTTVTAQDSTSTLTYTIAVTRQAAVTLTLSPSTGALPDGWVGAAYGQSFVASGGSGNYSFAVTAGTLPTGMSLSAGGMLTGSPTTAESTSFTVTVTDLNAPLSTRSASYTLQIGSLSEVIVSPSDGSQLPDAMAGEAYSVKISATGGIGPYVYRTIRGELPDGMVLNVSTGEISGPANANTLGAFSFTIEASTSTGARGTASYSLNLSARGVTVPDHEVIVPEGRTPPNIDLTSGTTGGPFLDAVIASVEPANAGSARIVDTQYAQTGGATPQQFYLKFTPNPAFSGQARVRYQLISSMGTSNLGVVSYTLTYSPSEVVSAVDSLVREFVQTRQNLISSTIKLPGIVERRRMEVAKDTVSTRLSPSNDGLSLNVAISLAQMHAAGRLLDGIQTTPAAPLPFNIWIDGTLMVHNRQQNGGRWGSFAMVSAGADYLINDHSLVGLSLHYDRMNDPTDQLAHLSGNGWLAGPYASFELGTGVFWDSSVLYGRSSNAIDTGFWGGRLNTRRLLFDTAISGRWHLDQVTTVTPKLSAVYLNESVQNYSVENGNSGALSINGFKTEQLRVGLGAEIERRFTLEDGSSLTPRVGVASGFSGIDGSGAFGSVSAGASFQSQDAWSVDGGVLFNIEGNGQVSAGAKVTLGVRF